MCEFDVDFKRLVLYFQEVPCKLPPLVKVWLYMEKLRLNESEGFALLATCNNEYNYRKLQQAALIQDRALCHSFGGGQNNQFHARA